MDKLRDFLKSWPGRILMMLCLAPMVLLGLESYFSGGSLQADEVAKVGETPVSLNALQQEITTNRSRLLTQVDASSINDQALAQQTLDNMIHRSLLTEQARHLGMQVSEATLTSILSQDTAFLDADGKFSNDLFARFLQSNGLTKDRLFAIQRNEINVRQLMNGILLSAIYPTPQLNRLMNLQGQSRELWVKRLSWQSYADQVSLDDAEIMAYYEKHKDTLVSPKMVDLSYVALTPADIEVSAASDDELKVAYQEYLKQNNIGQKQLSQILLTGDNVKKADEIKTKLASGTSFEELAKTYSDDPSGKTGGDIGAYNPAVFGADAQKVDAAIATLAVGGVSEPVQTSFGVQFFKVTAVGDAPSFDSLKETLSTQVQAQKLKARFDEVVGEINNKAVDGFGLKDIADELKLTVQKIDNYKAKDQELMGQPAIVKEAFDEFNLQEGSVSSPIEMAGSTIWVQSSNYRAEAPMTLEVAKTHIKELLTKEKATALALADAKKIAEGQVDVASFDKVGIANLQTSVLNAAELSSLFINDASGDKPAVWAVASETGASVLVGGKIQNQSGNPAQAAMAAMMIKSIVGQDHLEDYLHYLQTVHPVQTNADLLKTL